MISHILKTASDSKLFQEIHVSTEDNEIFDLVSEQGYPPAFKRPNDLADDESPIMPVLKSVANTYASLGKLFDEIWLLMACAPLIETTDLKNAAALYKDHNGQHSILAVAEYAVPIEWAFDLDEQGKLAPIQPGMFATASSKFQPKYYDTGSFAVFSSDHVLKSKNAGIDSNFAGCIVPRCKAVDIDNENDWTLAEALFRTSHKQNT